LALSVSGLIFFSGFLWSGSFFALLLGLCGLHWRGDDRARARLFGFLGSFREDLIEEIR
jgi:hypothetical protein